MPVPIWFTVPVPEMAPATVRAASDRLKARTLLLTTAPVPSVPVVLPAPTWSVPAEMVVVPV